MRRPQIFDEIPQLMWISSNFAVFSEYMKCWKRIKIQIILEIFLNPKQSGIKSLFKWMTTKIQGVPSNSTYSNLISISDFSDCPIKKDYMCNKTPNGHLDIHKISKMEQFFYTGKTIWGFISNLVFFDRAIRKIRNWNQSYQSICIWSDKN